MPALETQFTLLGLGINVSAEPAFPLLGSGTLPWGPSFFRKAALRAPVGQMRACSGRVLSRFYLGYPGLS